MPCVMCMHKQTRTQTYKRVHTCTIMHTHLYFHSAAASWVIVF